LGQYHYDSDDAQRICRLDEEGVLCEPTHLRYVERERDYQRRDPEYDCDSLENAAA